MPGRIFSSSNQYRYGFNGKEKETESPVQYDYGFRIYDPRLMRFKSVDPLQKKYSGENPYLYTGGNPIIYGDPDGRDRILMITIINEDGSMTRLQQTDFSKFNYTKENVYDGGMKYYRSSEIVDLIIDNRFGAQTTVDQAMNNPDAGNVRIQRTTIDEEQISGLTYYIYKIFGNPTNDRHLKSKVGIFTYGKGLNLGWQKMNETAAEGSESINLESLLDVVGAIGPNSSPSELYNEIVQKWMKHAGKDMKEVLTAINMIVKASDGATEAIDNGQTSIETIKKLFDDSPSLDPGNNKKETVAYCPYCQTNYRDSLNIWVPTRKPASDTMTQTQQTPPNKNPLQKKQN